MEIFYNFFKLCKIKGLKSSDLLFILQYLGLGVELLSPSNRSTMKQQQRQTSQRAQDFEQDLRKLKQQMASPESESASENADLNSTASLLFSNVIIQSRQDYNIQFIIFYFFGKKIFLTGNSFQKEYFYIVDIHFYKVNIQFFKHFTRLFFKILFVQVQAFKT